MCSLKNVLGISEGITCECSCKDVGWGDIKSAVWNIRKDFVLITREVIAFPFACDDKYSICWYEDDG